MKSKIIYVDFDDTIFIWDIHSLADVYLKSWEDYKNIGHLSNVIVDYLKEQKNTSEIVLLTHCRDSVELRMKQAYLEHLCPGLFDDYLSVSDPDVKLDIINRSETLYHINPCHAVLIDDRLKTRVLVADHGFLTENPLNIADRYYNREKDKQKSETMEADFDIAERG